MPPKTSRCLRFGIIGVGAMGQEHIRNLLILPDVSVVALADTHEVYLEQAASLLDGSSGGSGKTESDNAKVRTFSDYDELLRLSEVDVIIIATPNFHHIEVLRKALKTKKHILIEKPVCTRVEDLAEVCELAKDYPGVLWVGMEYRYIPAVARLVREVHEGNIGDLHMLSIREHRFPFLLKVNSWNRFSVNTGGTLTEKCVHFFDLMRYITRSEPVLVFAIGGQSVNHKDEVIYASASDEKEKIGEIPDILDNAYVVVEFANNVRCCLDLCMFAEASKNQEEIVAVGSNGKVEAFAPAHGVRKESEEANVRIGKRSPWKYRVTPPDPTSIRVSEIHEKVDPRLLQVGFHHGATFRELEGLCQAVRNGDQAQVSLLDGVVAALIGIAAHRSIAQRQPIYIKHLLVEMEEHQRALRRKIVFERARL